MNAQLKRLALESDFTQGLLCLVLAEVSNDQFSKFVFPIIGIVLMVSVLYRRWNMKNEDN